MEPCAPALPLAHQTQSDLIGWILDRARCPSAEDWEPTQPKCLPKPPTAPEDSPSPAGRGRGEGPAPDANRRPVPVCWILRRWVPIEATVNGEPCVLEVSVLPGETAQQVMGLLFYELPQLERYELWCWPENKLLLGYADLYRIVFSEGQRLYLRPKPGLFRRIGRWDSDEVYRRE